MTESEAHRRCLELGLSGRRDGDFYLLVRPGVELLARGSTWDEAFARLETPAPEALPAPVQRSLFEGMT